jgi:serine/threonine protein kinase
LNYSISLMETVLKLHNQAGMLHCSLKPANVRWNNGVVKLIDFEWAQKIDGAVYHPAPPGFRAPEIVRRDPCSIKSDAFSIGVTIYALLLDLEWDYRIDVEQDEICQVLKATAREFFWRNPKSRLSLQLALDQVKNKTRHLDQVSMSTRHSADSMVLDNARSENSGLCPIQSLDQTSANTNMKQFTNGNL